jgi:hypothetical protein
LGNRRRQPRRIYFLDRQERVDERTADKKGEVGADTVLEEPAYRLLLPGGQLRYPLRVHVPQECALF